MAPRGQGGGRKPTPTRLKVVRGTDQPCRTNQDEPKPPADNIKMPAGLSPLAKKQWRKVCRQLKEADIITTLDVHALVLFCEVYARWVEANAKVVEHGTIIKSPNGHWVQSPYLAIANKAFDQMKGMLVEFGMTPSSRTRVGTASGGKGADTGGWGNL